MSSDRHDVLRRDAVGYDPARGTYHLQHDDLETPSMSYTVLRGVAAITGEEPHHLEPLSETIDPDALDSLFDPVTGDGDGSTACLSFRYCGCQVDVYADGHVVLEPPVEW